MIQMEKVEDRLFPCLVVRCGFLIHHLFVQSNNMICFFGATADLLSNTHIPVVLTNYWPPTCERNLTLSSPFTGEIFYK